MDNQIIRYLFTATAEACDRLQIDADLKQALQKTIGQLPPNQIAKDGRLMEWLKEYQEAEPHHRHVSHLWGLYPASEINMNTPELADAARKTLAGRGDEAHRLVTGLENEFVGAVTRWRPCLPDHCNDY